MTARPVPRMRILTIGGRPCGRGAGGTRAGRRCCCATASAASLELFEPFVDALDPRRAVIRFDMPGIGESPGPVVPYHLATLAPLLTGLLDQLGDHAGRRPRHLLGRRARAAVRAEPAGPGAPPGTGGDRDGRAHGPRAPASAAAHAHAAATPGPGTRGPHRRRAVRRQPAGGPGPGPRAAARHGTPGPGPGLLLPADLRPRLDQPAAAAQAAAAHPDPGRGRRPDHPAGQRADHAPADTAQPAARLSRRPPRAGRRRRTPGTRRGGLPGYRPHRRGD